MMEPIVTQCQHGALQSGCGRCKDTRISELETEVILRGEAIAVLNKALANDSQIVAQWQAKYRTAQQQIKALRGTLEMVQSEMGARGWNHYGTYRGKSIVIGETQYEHINTVLASTAPRQKEGE